MARARPRPSRSVTGTSARHRPLVVIIHGGFWRPDIDRLHCAPWRMPSPPAGWTVGIAGVLARCARPRADAGGSDCRCWRRRPAACSATTARWCWSGIRPVAIWRCGPPPRGSGPGADWHAGPGAGRGSDAGASKWVWAMVPWRAFSAAEPGEPSGASIRARCPARATATTLVHGVEDDTVPLAVSESYVAAHPPARLVAVADAGHFALIDPHAPAWAASCRSWPGSLPAKAHVALGIHRRPGLRRRTAASSSGAGVPAHPGRSPIVLLGGRPETAAGGIDLDHGAFVQAAQGMTRA